MVKNGNGKKLDLPVLWKVGCGRRRVSFVGHARWPTIAQKTTGLGELRYLFDMADHEV
jgi:hypothetical protein